MLVLSRKVNEKIVVTSPDGTLITLMLVEIRGDKARIGVDAPKSWSIHRAEIQALVDAE
jgi:carbon storage regulator